MRIAFLLTFATVLSGIMSSTAEREPIVSGPIAGGVQDISNSNDAHLEDITQFALAHLEKRNSGSGTHFVRYRATLQVVSGLKYTLFFKANDKEGNCVEESKVVVYDKPWLHQRTIEQDVTMGCS
ncbi:unnamed protein product [Discosporangium mesarthrocarpum]